MQLKKIKKTQDYQYITNQSERVVRRGFVLLGKPFPVDEAGDVYFGITASRKLGGAVQRNRIKRRLKEAINQVLVQHGRAGWGFVFIGRRACADISFEKLRADIQQAVSELLGKGKA